LAGKKNVRVFFLGGGSRGNFLLPLSRYQPVWQRLESDEQQIVLATLEQGKILQKFLEVNLPRVTTFNAAEFHLIRSRQM